MLGALGNFSNNLSSGSCTEGLVRRNDPNSIDSLSREDILAELKKNGYVNIIHLSTGCLIGMLKDGRKNGSIPPCVICRKG